MYTLGCSRCSREPEQLGALIPTAVSTGITLLSKTGIFGNPNDAKRLDAIDRRYALAEQGDVGSLLVLKCWAGLPTPELNEFPDLAADVGVTEDGTNCGMATDAAKKYAMLKYQAALALPKVADALVNAGIRIAGVGVRMGSPTAQKAIQGAGIAALAIGGLAVFMLARSRRR